MTEGPATLENRTFDEITVGDSASATRTLTRDDIALFTAVSGDVNPIHLDERLAEASPLRREVGHSLWGGGLISGLLGTRLPGPGTICVAQDLSFLRPVGLGDTLTATMTAREKRPETKTVVVDCACTNHGGDRLIAGIAEVTAPAAKIRVPRGELPDVALRRHEGYQRLIERYRGIEAIATAVAHPLRRVLPHCRGRRRRGRHHCPDPGRPRAQDPARRRGTPASTSGATGSSTRRTATRRPRRPWRWCGPGRPRCS